MGSNRIYDGTTRLFELFHTVYIINRFEALLAYNVGYLLVILAIAHDPARILGRVGLLAVFFAAVLLAKGEASIADALHDYEADRTNPEKSYVSEAVDWLGRGRAAALLAVQVVLSFAACLYLTYVTGHPIFVFAAVWGNFIGFFYSYPPRFKERGVLNHVLTTSGDIVCVLLPGAVLLVGALGPIDWAAIGVVAAYAFAYHVLHQAADTYYDRQAGLDTFTQSVGVAPAVGIAAVFTGVATVVAFSQGLLVGAVTLVATVHLWRLYARASDASERRATELVAENFSISTWATVLNVSTAASVAVAKAGLPWSLL